MKHDAVRAHLNAMATQSGISACALVDADTGLVWHAAGEPLGDTDLWEAAIDSWRMHQRQKHRFAALGALGAAVLYHQHSTLAVLPVSGDPALLLVALARRSAVDWSAWQKATRELTKRVQRQHQPLAP